MCVTAASGGSVLYDQCVPFAILKPKKPKNRQLQVEADVHTHTRFEKGQSSHKEGRE